MRKTDLRIAVFKLGLRVFKDLYKPRSYHGLEQNRHIALIVASSGIRTSNVVLLLN